VDLSALTSELSVGVAIVALAFTVATWVAVNWKKWNISARGYWLRELESASPTFKSLSILMRRRPDKTAGSIWYPVLLAEGLAIGSILVYLPLGEYGAWIAAVEAAAIVGLIAAEELLAKSVTRKLFGPNVEGLQGRDRIARMVSWHYRTGIFVLAFGYSGILSPLLSNFNKQISLATFAPFFVQELVIAIGAFFFVILFSYNRRQIYDLVYNWHVTVAGVPLVKVRVAWNGISDQNWWGSVLRLGDRLTLLTAGGFIAQFEWGDLDGLGIHPGREVRPDEIHPVELVNFADDPTQPDPGPGAHHKEAVPTSSSSDHAN